MENNMFKLYYGKGIDLSNEIEEHYFKTIDELICFIDNAYLNNDKNIVYLFTEDDYENKEIFISTSPITFINYLNNFEHELNSKFSLHEYQSFESAYSVALDMRESNPLCYDKD